MYLEAIRGLTEQNEQRALDESRKLRMDIIELEDMVETVRRQNLKQDQELERYKIKCELQKVQIERSEELIALLEDNEKKLLEKYSPKDWQGKIYIC